MKKSRLLGMACACELTFVTTLTHAVVLPLESRLGGLAYYDPNLNITWLADANYAMTSGYDADGLMSWYQASTWVASLDIDGVPDADGWRLPNTIDVGNDGFTYTNEYQGVDYGYNITTHSELSNMFYNMLGNTAAYDTSGTATGCLVSPPNYCLTNTSPFSNLQSDTYLSATEYTPDTPFPYEWSWNFSMLNGFQSSSIKPNEYYAWAVYSDDISTVPVPAAAWLFGSGLLGLIGVTRKRKQLK